MTATRSVTYVTGVKCKEDVEAGADGAEQQHESSVSHPEGIPRVADESEDKGQVEGDGGHEPEIGELVRLQVQFVLEKKAYRNIDQASGGGTEGQQNDQDAEVEENPLPHRLRKVGGSDGDGRCCGRWTVGRHRAQSSPVETAGRSVLTVALGLEVDRHLSRPSCRPEALDEASYRLERVDLQGPKPASVTDSLGAADVSVGEMPFAKKQRFAGG